MAGAPPIPGATYRGSTPEGVSITFTVSSDGTLVDSYTVANAHGRAANGTGCTFLGSGNKDEWSGAPITGESFSYEVGTAITFAGTFTGSQSASGTFRFDAPPEGASQGCDTGTVSWTATTTAKPNSGSGGSGGSGSGGTSGGSGGKGSGDTGGTGSGSGGSGKKSGAHAKRSVTTRVSLRKLSAKRLGGRLTVNVKSCRARRMVYLWRGSKRVASTKATVSGTYSFARWASLRNRAVRATTKRLTTRSVVCAAGSSPFTDG